MNDQPTAQSASVSGAQPEAAAADGAPAVAVVIPCYRVTDKVLDVIGDVPPEVARIYCVDDGCPDGSGKLIEEQCDDDRVSVLRHARNQGVGAAMVTGYRQALADDAQVVVKVDGDGQMDPTLINRFVAPITAGEADYTKGNRFFSPGSLAGMPPVRLFGNAALSFLSKFSTGYWTTFDPNNGYTAIHASVLRALPLERLAKGYFFEADMLFRLSTVRAVVQDIPMRSVYRDETSDLRVLREILPFMWRHTVNFCKRIVYSYFLRDFHLASIEWLIGPALLLFGVLFGANEWLESARSGVPATAGQVMISALPVIIGIQMLLSAINFDIQNVPRRPIHDDLDRIVT